MRWALFNILILILLAVDLFIINRKPHKQNLKKDLLFSAFWISLALLFNIYIYYSSSPEAALEFFTGYVVEKSLSIDNLFVMAMIFSYFKIPEKDQHRVLFWGILGAFAMRLLFILGGTALMHKFEWLLYVLGAFLILTGIKFLWQSDKKRDLEKSWGQKTLARIFPKASPFMLALITIEYTDLVFAMDSLPAIFAITSDPFIIYTSNVFAILGMRSLYFVLAHYLKRLIYLKVGLALILIFVGFKMIISHYIDIPVYIALGVIILILAVCIFMSLRKKKK